MFLKNRRIEVNVGRTVNLGNYESERIDISLGGDIEIGEDVDNSISEIHTLLTKIINQKIIEAKERN